MPIGEQEEPVVRRYLLGLLGEEERSNLEKRLFDDDELFEAVQACEMEIIRDYVRGNLPNSERRSFEQYCQLNPALLAKVEAEKSFAALLKPSWRERLAAVFATPQLSFAMAGGLAAVLALAFWLGFENNRLRTELAEMHTPQSSRPAKFLLSPGVLRGEAQRARRLTIASAQTAIQFDLEVVKAEANATYRARLERVGGGEVASGRVTVSRAELVSVTFETAGIVTDDYIVWLEVQKPDGQYEVVESYSVGIRRE